MPAKRKIFFIALTTSATLLLTACPKKEPDLGSQSFQGTNATACSQNQYLQKYHCKFSEVRAAALSGDRDAKYALGYMYYNGIDTPRDAGTASAWIKEAAAQGQPLAAKAQHMLETQGSLEGSSENTSAEDGASSGGPVPQYRSTNIDAASQRTPTKPLTNELPNYNSGDAATKNQGTTTAAPPMSRAETELLQATGAYTLQLMASVDLASIRSFVHQNRLDHKTKYFYARYRDNTWYVLLYGRYSSPAQATAALHHLPPAIRALHPWVKPTRVVKQEIVSRRIG